MSSATTYMRLDDFDLDMYFEDFDVDMYIDDDLNFNFKNDVHDFEEIIDIKSEVLSWVYTIALALIAAFIITNYLIINASIPTGSMMDTIMPNDRVIAFRWSYTFAEPQREDIVIFKYPDMEDIPYVKRIIGMPGDKVEIIDGNVYLNDSPMPLQENYLRQKPLGSFGPYHVPENHYFMLGDNRNNSEDSRYWKNTYVEREKILGKVLFRYYPTPEVLYNQ